MKLNTLNKGLVGRWQLDAVHGLKDLTQNANNGSGYNGITIGGAADKKGVANMATTFDGSTKYINCPNGASLQLTTKVSVSAWVKQSEYGVYNCIIGKWVTTAGNRHFQMGIYTNGKMFFATNGTKSVIMGGVTVTQLDTWYHLVGTYDGIAQTQDIYLNGVKEVPTYPDGVTTSLPASDVSVVIGGYGYPSVVEIFHGNIYDVRIYNRALTQPEVTLLYNSYKPAAALSSIQKGLVGYWKLDTLHGIKDLTSNANNGSAQGGIVIGGAADVKGLANAATTFTSSNYIMCNETDILKVTKGTISAWIYPSTTTGYRPIVSYINNYDAGTYGYIFLVRAGALGYMIANASYTEYFTIDSISTNTWYHVAMTFDNARVKVYKNGLGVYDAAVTRVPAFTAGNTFFIGREDNQATYYTFGGIIYDVRLHNRALTAPEIMLMYNSYT